MQETPKTIMDITSDLLKSLTAILQRNIEALQRDSHPLLQHRIQQEIEYQRGLLQQIEEVKERLQNYLNAPAPDPDVDLRNDEIRRQSYPPGGALGVTMFGKESGTKQIRFPDTSDTLVKAIEKIGIERAKEVGLICRGVPLIDTVNHPGIRQGESGRYFIVTNSNTTTKIKQLNKIADELDEDLITDHL